MNVSTNSLTSIIEKEEVQGFVEGLIGEYGWLLLIAITTILAKDMIMNFAQGILVFMGNNFNNDDIKLINDKAKKVISDFNSQLEKIDLPSREILEPIVNGLIKSHGTNFKGVGQPLRIALTGSKFGPGVYDIILSLGKEEVQKRLSAKIA